MEPFVERRVEPSSCMAHPQYEGMILDLKETAKALVEGQMEMKMTLIQLTENLKGLERLERRVDRIEEKHAKDDSIQGNQIDELRKFMYKMTGAIAVISVCGPLLMKVAMALIL